MIRDRDREKEKEKEMTDGAGSHPRQSKADEMMKRASFWIFMFMGAAAIGNVFALRRRLLSIERGYAQGNSTRHGGDHGSSAQYEKWGSGKGEGERYARAREASSAREAQRQWQVHIEEQQRRERIRRMQEAFAREKGSYTKTYEAWHERHGDKWDWRREGDRWEWKGEEQRQQAEREKERKRSEEKKHVSSYELLKRARLGHHYAVLGLDATRRQPYSDTEIKAAFRSKALEYHPDQNQVNKQAAEVKFRQLLESYHMLRAQSSSNRTT